ncbi:MAG: hypothetical protein IPK22_19145 [Verrucomicrobiaceae bacterium]|nr:hypothetical protein [Verrucomicrobiaceae bacterium]
MKHRLLPTLILFAAWSLLPAVLSAQQISVADVVVTEEDGQAVFTLTLSQAVSTPVTVNYETTDATAVAAEDYTATSGMVTFPANVLTRTVSVPIINDSEGELDETFYLNLSNVSANANIATDSAVGTILESDITALNWDPGSADLGSVAQTGSATPVGRRYFKITTQTTLRGGWRTALQVTAGEADLHASQGSLPTPGSAALASGRTGSDGWVVSNDSFTAGAVWYVLVDVTNPATWRLYSGDVFVQDMGTLQYTDTNGNSAYTIGEPVLPSGSGTVAIGPEGMRFFTGASPSGTPAWSLWLNGDNRDLAVRQGAVPFHGSGPRDHVQSGAMLMVPDYIDSGFTQFFSVEGNPGETVNLDSRIQSVTDIAFESTQANVNVTAAPFRVYRVQVPIDQIAWDVAVTAHSGNPNLCVRRDVVPSEWFNDAISEVDDGAATDSVTLVPPTLTNGTWFITVYGTGSHQFTLRNGIPVITPMNYVDTKINDLITRAGWRYYAVSDIPSQLGSLGWQLELANQVPGTEIAIRRNAVPGRWRNHNGFGQTSYGGGSHVDNSRSTGLLQIPGHEADIWYVGIYWPSAPLGAFTLQATDLSQTPVAFAGGSTSVSGHTADDWRWFRVDVPPGVLGWDVRLRDVSGGGPQMVVRRDLLPASANSTNDSNFYYGRSMTWPSGYQWIQGTDWTGRYTNAANHRFLAAMGRPLEPGTYYVGVYNGNYPAESTSYTLESRGIGAGQFYPVTDLAFAAGSSATISGLEPREPRYFKVTVPANMRSWEITLDPILGEMMLAVRRGYVPAVGADDGTQGSYGDQQSRVQKVGVERHVILPASGQDYLEPGDYYLAVVSEGQNPSGSTIGSGPVSGTLTSRGALVVTDLGTASEVGVGGPVGLVGGQLKAFRFSVPAGTSQLELRLSDRVGQPLMTLNGGLRLPGISIYDYGADDGDADLYDSGTGLISIANPAPGDYSLMVYAGSDFSSSYDEDADPASATLLVQAVGPVPVVFNGGTASVGDQGAGSWKYFRIDVPAGVLGWDVRLRDVSGGGPQMVVRRDLLPASANSTNDSNFYYGRSMTWPSGYQWIQGTDWTGRYTNAANHRFLAAMGRPLEPGTYYVGVYNGNYPAESTSYTLESRGIGAGQFYPVTDLAFAAGSSATISGLEPREPRYFKVTVPANMRSWEITLDPILGEMMLAVRRGYVPAVGADDGTQGSYGDQQSRVQKVGVERHVILPASGQDYLEPGDYYLAVVSEGQNPSGSTIGSGPVSGTLTSRGALVVTDLGTASEVGVGGPVGLVGGQLKAFRFSVPAGTSQLELRLNDRVGQPLMTLNGGLRLPGISIYDYGADDGDADLYDSGTGLISIANPAPGDYSLMVYAGSDFSSSYDEDADPASATLLVQAVGPVPVVFNGGTASVGDQGAGSWKYFRIDVPAGVLGWDVRLRDVSGGGPQMVVRRDLLPASANSTNDSNFYYGRSMTWPSGYQWIQGTDWTGRYTNAANHRFLAAMGRPLEPGTYYVGVYNGNYPAESTSYTLESRGIGAGQFYPVTDLAFAAGSSATISGLEPREPRYFKVTVPANMRSWEITLDPILGEMMLAVRRGYVPAVGADDGTQGSYGDQQSRVQKVGGRAARHPTCFRPGLP